MNRHDSDELVLGNDVDTGSPVKLAQLHRLRGMYVIGRTGTGKSTFLESLIVQDIQHGRGVCVLDPHGSLVARVIRQVPASRVEDVVLLDTNDRRWPFGLNPLWCPDLSQDGLVDEMASDFVELIEMLWGPEGIYGTSWGPRIPSTLQNLALVFLENPGSNMAQIARFISDGAFRREMVSKCTNVFARLFWEQFDSLPPRAKEERTESSLNKLQQFLTDRSVSHIVCQETTTLDFRRLMDEQRIVLVSMDKGKSGDQAVSLLGAYIIQQILNSALDRGANSNSPQFHLYADEFARFAVPAFEELFTDARKYGVATVVAHQERGQIGSKILAAVSTAGNKVVFSVSGEDAEDLAKDFDRTPPPPEASGRRQILSVSQDPIGHLARSGHNDSQVSHVVALFIRRLYEEGRNSNSDHIWQVRDASSDLFEDGGWYYYSRDTLQNGIELLNRFLVNVMEGRQTVEDERSCAQLAEAVITLRAFFRIAPSERFYKIQRPLEFTLPAGSVRHPSYEDAAIFPLSAVTELALRDYVGFEAEDDVTESGSILREFEELRVQYWGNHFKDGLRPKSSRDLLAHVAERRASKETEILGTVVQNMIYLAKFFAEEPLKVDSGQWEAVSDHPRTFADVQSEIANSLVHQPQFTAVAEVIENGAPVRHKLRTARYAELIIEDEAHKFADVPTIIDLSRERYCRPRNEVELYITRSLFGNEASSNELADMSPPPRTQPPVRILPLDDDSPSATRITDP